MTAAQPGRPDTEDRGGARVERWFLRVMLGVSAVAWSLLLLAELGWFRLVPAGPGGVPGRGHDDRVRPVGRLPHGSAGARHGRRRAAAGAGGGGRDPAVRRAVPPAVPHRDGRRRRHRLSELRPADRPPRRARVRGSAAAPTVARQPCRAVPESGAPRHDGPVCTIPRRLPDRRHHLPDGHRGLFPAVSGPDRPGPRPRLAEVLGLLRESVLLQAGAALAAGLLVAAGVVGIRRPAERWPRWLWGLAAARG